MLNYTYLEPTVVANFIKMDEKHFTLLLTYKNKLRKFIVPLFSLWVPRKHRYYEFCVCYKYQKEIYFAVQNSPKFPCVVRV